MGEDKWVDRRSASSVISAKARLHNERRKDDSPRRYFRSLVALSIETNILAESRISIIHSTATRVSIGRERERERQY